MFKFERCTSTGTSLSTCSPVLLRKFNRKSKYDPLLTSEVGLLEANPQYGFIKYTDGQESTVSLRHLAASSGNELQHDPLNDHNDLFMQVLI